MKRIDLDGVKFRTDKVYLGYHPNADTVLQHLMYFRFTSHNCIFIKTLGGFVHRSNEDRNPLEDSVRSFTTAFMEKDRSCHFLERSGCEIYELTDDEINKHILMEMI